MSEKEDLLILMETMVSKTSGLTRTEIDILGKAINHLKTDEINLAKRIKNMIEANDATTDEILQFCDNFIKTKEEEYE